MNTNSRNYWDRIAADYQAETRILTTDFHYGPLLPGDRELGLLPDELRGLRCLEGGCGSAQNSIYLASRGARCTALDLAGRQLQHGLELIRAEKLQVNLCQADLEAIPVRAGAAFDLVHSAYALPFVERQREAVSAMASLLCPGGLLILSVAHPLATWEWLNVDADSGILVTDYFSPPPDTRNEGSDGQASCRAVPLSTTFAWLRENGLIVEHMLEPKPMPVEHMTRKDIEARVPYWSEAWLSGYGDSIKIPVVAIFAARKPA